MFVKEWFRPFCVEKNLLNYVDIQLVNKNDQVVFVKEWQRDGLVLDLFIYFHCFSD